MFAQIATFLIDTIVSFLVFLLLARFHFQWLRVPFRNPMGEFLLATTSWLVLPARRVIPGLVGPVVSAEVSTVPVVGATAVPAFAPAVPAPELVHAATAIPPPSVAPTTVVTTSTRRRVGFFMA